MYLLLELGPSIRRLNFGENVHIEVLYSELGPPAGIELGDVYCF